MGWLPYSLHPREGRGKAAPWSQAGCWPVQTRSHVDLVSLRKEAPPHPLLFEGAGTEKPSGLPGKAVREGLLRETPDPQWGCLGPSFSHPPCPALPSFQKASCL